jgi:hypothetical protein
MIPLFGSVLANTCPNVAYCNRYSEFKIVFDSRGVGNTTTGTKLYSTGVVEYNN